MSNVVQATLLSNTSASRSLRDRIRDFVALTKPRITIMVLTTTAGGLFLAPTAVPARVVVCALLGMALIVGGANALNMVIERDVDAHMTRTRLRPLPAGRMSAKHALVFGVALSVLAVPVLAFGVNALTALLAVLANVIYVLAYTPLKQRSHLALEVGAIPGAMPPAPRVDGRHEPGRRAPRSCSSAITLFLAAPALPRDRAIPAKWLRTARARPQGHSRTCGETTSTKHAIVRYCAILLAVSLLLFPLGVAHRTYLFSALGLGAVLLRMGMLGAFARRAIGAGRGPSSGSRSCTSSSLFAMLMVDRKI